MQTTIDDIIRIADDLHLESASQDLAYLKGQDRQCRIHQGSLSGGFGNTSGRKLSTP